MPRGQPLQLALQEQAGIDRRLQEFRRGNVIENREARGAHQWIAVERAALIAVFETRRMFGRQQCSERHAAADAFAERHDVGLDASVLVMEQLSGAAQTPASPWIGSSMTATVLSEISRFTESRSLSCALGKPGTLGSNNGSNAFLPDADMVASVRP